MSDTQTIEKHRKIVRNQQLSENDIETLVSYVNVKADSARKRGTQRSLIDELLILLLVHTGVRGSEMCELNLGDLSLSERGDASIQVRSESLRILPIPVDLLEKFYKHIKLYRDCNRPDAPLLVGERGDRMTSQSIYLKVKSIGKKAGLDGLSPNMIRRYFLCQLYDKEQDLKLIQKAGGYCDPQVAARSLRLLG